MKAESIDAKLKEIIDLIDNSGRFVKIKQNKKYNIPLHEFKTADNQLSISTGFQPNPCKLYLAKRENLNKCSGENLFPEHFHTNIWITISFEEFFSRLSEPDKKFFLFNMEIFSNPKFVYNPIKVDLA